MSKVKLFVFADYHYCLALYLYDQSEFDEIVERLHKANADVIFEFGGKSGYSQRSTFCTAAMLRRCECVYN